MSATTPILGLTLYDSTTDQSVTFATFRAVWGGTATTSNFYKIDTAIGTIQTNITNLQNTRGALVTSAVYVSANYYEASVSSISSYLSGMTILLSLDTTSSGTVTLNINSLGTKSVMKIDSSGTPVNISGGELMADRYYLFVYDGTRWVWVNGTSEDQLYASGASGNIITVGSNGVFQSTLNLDTVYSGIKPPATTMYNGKFVPSVSSNNLTLSLKTFSGSDPSSSDPVYITIGNTVRKVTSSLSVTKNAGTNWFNSGSSELATNEIDYFIYAGYNSTDGVVLGFSRIPYANIYSDFSTTTTSDKYCAISNITNASSGDDYVLIGRFAATLSAGAGYTWSVPTFNTKNLIQYPIYTTRPLLYTPTFTWTAGADPSGAVGTSRSDYQISYNILTLNVTRLQYATGGTTVTALQSTLPMSLTKQYQTCVGYLANSGVPVLGYSFVSTGLINVVNSSSTVNRVFIQGSLIIN